MAPRKKNTQTSANDENENKPSSIDIIRVEHNKVTVYVVGDSPFVCNAMSAKAQRELLMPRKKMNKAERDTRLKHDPLDEYRRSVYRSRSNSEPTRILFPSAGFKRAMATAALEIPGTNKTQIGRLCWAEGQYVSIYGIPQLWMSVVRSADMAHTPDVRTRAIIPEWAAVVTIDFVIPQLNTQSVINLLASAGIFVGVGDGRPEKGALDNGRFRIVTPNDVTFKRIAKMGGRVAQDKALAKPTFYDTESEELMEWWKAEVRRRGFEKVAS